MFVLNERSRVHYILNNGLLKIYEIIVEKFPFLIPLHISHNFYKITQPFSIPFRENLWGVNLVSLEWKCFLVHLAIYLVASCLDKSRAWNTWKSFSDKAGYGEGTESGGGWRNMEWLNSDCSFIGVQMHTSIVHIQNLLGVQR